MPNTNFQTIHQFGAGINQVVRQATGRDPVQNIEMGHVTVAQAKRLRIVDTYTGNPLTLTANRDSYIGAELGMAIKQNLNGQDYAWPAGCGVNIWDEQWEPGSFNTTTGLPVSTTTAFRTKNFIAITPGRTYFNHQNSGYNLWAMFYDASSDLLTDIAEVVGSNDRSNSAFRIMPNHTFVIPENAHFMKFHVAGSTTYTGNEVSINYPSDYTSYYPYANVCPITPWESVLVTVNDVDDHLTTFPQQVYAGTFNAWTGELQITHKCKKVSDMHWSRYTPGDIQTFAASATTDTQDMTYNSSPFTIPIVCSAYRNYTSAPESGLPDFAIWNGGSTLNPILIRDSRYDGATIATWKRDMGDTQICYPLQDPIILQLHKEEIPADEGENTVSTNADTLTVTLYEAV